MSKAEDYITQNTKTLEEYDKEYFKWLTPDQARRAVEIAREEVIEETVEWLTKHAKKYYFNKDRCLGTDELVEDYKLIMSMKDE